MLGPLAYSEFSRTPNKWFLVDAPVCHEGNEGSQEGGSTSPSQEGDESHEVNRVGSQERSSHMDGQ